MAKTAAKKKPAATAASKNASAKHATPQPKKKKPTKAALAKRQKAAAAAEQAAAARVLGPMAWRPSVLQQHHQQQQQQRRQKPKATVAEGVVPYTLPQPQDDKRDLFWPSALFFNVEYKNGILVDNKKKTEAYFEESQGYSNNNNKDSDGCRTQSCLSEVEADLWGQKHAAHTAVARRFPIEVGRLLGTITLELEETLAPVATSHTKKAKTTLKTAPPPGPLPASLQNTLTKYRRKLKHSANPKYASAKYEQVRKLSHKHAMDEVHRELQQCLAALEPTSDESDDSPSPPRVSAQDSKKSRAHYMMQQWQAVQECPHQYREHWHGKDGSLCHVDHNRPVDDRKALLQAPTHSAQGRVQLNGSVARREETAKTSQAKKKKKNKSATGNAMFGTDHDNDVHHVPLMALKTWLTQGLIHNTIRDVHQDKIKSLYRGLTQVPVNAGTILEALSNLANPNAALYGVPLVVTYARMVPCLTSNNIDEETDDTKATKRGKTRKRADATCASRNNKTTWKVQIGIYMHRLLPEIFDRESLHIVMSALDEGSYKIEEPLRLPPAGPSVFESAAYPRVDTSVLDVENYDANGKKHTVEVIDVDADMEGGSRDDMVLSPFSTKGLLKLLENTGCDVSEWPRIEQQLQGKFQLNLLLHQQHAICWMLQMEHLEGAYGINSLLWEQRTFPDGGHYYYSPALGQVRLGAPPPKMKGGLLCDEQGLGKTVEVLGLIMATLPELKRNVENVAERKAKPAYNYDDENYYSAESSDGEDGGEYLTHTTLIVVPPALVAQWLHEIEKAVGKTTLTVSMLVANTGELKKCLPAPASNGNVVPDNEEDDWDLVQASDIVVCTYDCLDKKTCSTLLHTVQWGRVVLDEMQEIRSSTTQIAKNCETLQCDRRWMLSGTPIFQGIQDLSGELNFLRLEPFGTGQNDGFYQFAVMTPWEEKHPHAISTLRILGLVALRRSKDMTIAGTGTHLLDLKPMTVEFMPVQQSHSERALYCWLEHIVALALEVQKKKKTDHGHEAKTAANSRLKCLNLLRQICITPMLLNGGVGMPSQMGRLNSLMIEHNRREQQSHASFHDDWGESGSRKKQSTTQVMSCEQALRFLTQHQEAAKTEDDFVTDARVGGGRGVTQREYATESAETRIEKARTSFFEAKRILKKDATRRAKARWHWALEMISTGQFSDGDSHKFSGLWKWRRLVCAAMERNDEEKSKRKPITSVPALLTRGWRPSDKFARTELPTNYPDFHWASPSALCCENIPKEVTQKELATAARDAAMMVPKAKEKIEKCLEKAKHLLKTYDENDSVDFEMGNDTTADIARLEVLLEPESKDNSTKEHTKVQELKRELEALDEALEESRLFDATLVVPKVIKIRERKNAAGFWRAIIKFECKAAATNAMKAFSRSAGALIVTRRPVPHIVSMEKAASESVGQLEAELKLYSSSATKEALKKAKIVLTNISKGLRLVTGTGASLVMEEQIREEAGTDIAFIVVAKAAGQLRSSTPRKASTLVASTQSIVAESTTSIFESREIISKAKHVLHQLNRVVNNGKVSAEIQKLSAYEILEALTDGQLGKTQCCICLDELGGTTSSSNSANITMLKCAHFYCTKCVYDYAHDRLDSEMSVNCPSCRKTFSLTRDTIQIDPSLKDEREAAMRERSAAKKLVRDAALALEESNGHLDPEMWRALYMNFDLPTNVPSHGSPTFTAIPREVLTHFRAATGMKTHCNKTDRPPAGSMKGAGRCSKVQRLLEDLPTDERAVVFSSNQDVLMHLKVVLEEENIGFQAIHQGQSTEELKDSVSNWEKDGETPTDPPPFPCLLVQAGAAASGLTLTAASKMFIMEPFIRHEQERQAYARCHRLTQTKQVTVKVYYTPVSVESRLLQWRKGGKAPLDVSDSNKMEYEQDKETTIIVHDVDEEESCKDDASVGSNASYVDDGGGEDSEDESDHEVDQANYLLGLHEL